MRALALFSGGLDSMLAIKLVTLQNIEVVALHINIGFEGAKDNTEVLKKRAQMAGASLQIVDVRKEYLEQILFSPKHGYGKQFNPCIDCHGFMFKVARELLKTYDASFVISGEVKGQRPMSQNVRSLKKVQELSGDDENILLRPLSAKIMNMTKPEIKGWIDREKLQSIVGRSRKIQLSLAQEFGFEDFQNPSGGCLLTDAFFTKKLRDFIKYSPLHEEDIGILKIGRHFRLLDGAKLVLGRDEAENNYLENLENRHFVNIKIGEELSSPSGKISINASEVDKKLACQIALSYVKIEKDRVVETKIGNEIFSQKQYCGDVKQFAILF